MIGAGKLATNTLVEQGFIKKWRLYLSKSAFDGVFEVLDFTKIRSGVVYSLDFLYGVVAAAVHGNVAEYGTYSECAMAIFNGKFLDEQWVYAWDVQIG